MKRTVRIVELVETGHIHDRRWRYRVKANNGNVFEYSKSYRTKFHAKRVARHRVWELEQVPGYQVLYQETIKYRG